MKYRVLIGDPVGCCVLNPKTQSKIVALGIFREGFRYVEDRKVDIAEVEPGTYIDNIGGEYQIVSGIIACVELRPDEVTDCEIIEFDHFPVMVGQHGFILVSDSKTHRILTGPLKSDKDTE